ncbi:DUF2232 domain-containing protein [Desulfitobacterium sp.]|uniref:DUF2232 domain-containing protein n=1 Tax=Desulfitobacterium sp. TaxID=49981 RepID=UPI002B215CE3|nr:DUF2232 domain-containing protein [Desulfitobacterium sp.]MEA4903185.1 DUF2232 domain-containing protein [Desulfitobacterium sp.]
MYVSDRKVTHVLAILALLAGPWFSVSSGGGGWLLDVALLIAVFWVGRNMGFKMAVPCLIVGYSAAFFGGGGLSSLMSIGFLPWTGLLTLWGIEHAWARKSNLFWSIVLAGVLGVVPIIPTLYQGIDTSAIQELIRSVMDQYRESGMLGSLNQKGLSEADIESYLQQFFQYLFFFIPGLTSVGAIFVYSLVYYFFARWFPQKDRPFPSFSALRLPWYAIWGASLGIACYLIGDQWSYWALRSFGMNLMFIYAFVALVLGSSIFIYYLRSPHLSGFLKWMLLFTSFFFMQITVIFLIIMGLLDLVLNFRHIPEEKQ